MNEYIYSWSFNSSKKRWNLWYIIALSIIIWLIIWSFLTKQYVLWFLILLMSWVYYFMENNSKDEVNIYIYELWIKIDNNFYEFTKINSFTIIYTDEFADVLRLYVDNKLINKIDLKIDNNILNDTYSFLSERINEDKTWWYTFVDKIVNFLKL